MVPDRSSIGPSAPTGGPPRRCACGASAPCVETTSARLGLLSVGKRFTHRCSACAAQFRVRSLGYVLFTFAYSPLPTALGVFLVVVPTGQAVGATRDNQIAGFVIALMGLLVLAWAVRAAVMLARHPIVRAG